MGPRYVTHLIAVRLHHLKHCIFHELSGGPIGKPLPQVHSCGDHTNHQGLPNRHTLTRTSRLR